MDTRPLNSFKITHIHRKYSEPARVARMAQTEPHLSREVVSAIVDCFTTSGCKDFLPSSFKAKVPQSSAPSHLCAAVSPSIGICPADARIMNCLPNSDGPAVRGEGPQLEGGQEDERYRRGRQADGEVGAGRGQAATCLPAAATKGRLSIDVLPA